MHEYLYIPRYGYARKTRLTFTAICMVEILLAIIFARW